MANCLRAGFFEQLQEEAMSNSADPIAVVAQRMWTSALRLRGREFCFILNDTVRKKKRSCFPFFAVQKQTDHQTEQNRLGTAAFITRDIDRKKAGVRRCVMTSQLLRRRSGRFRERSTSSVSRWAPTRSGAKRSTHRIACVCYELGLYRSTPEFHPAAA